MRIHTAFKKNDLIFSPFPLCLVVTRELFIRFVSTDKYFKLRQQILISFM